MDDEQFRTRAEMNQTLADYLDQVAADSGGEGAHRDGGATILFGVAAYCLYRQAKNFLVYNRGLNEAQLRETMIEEVKSLVASGWSQANALKTVQSISMDVAGLREDSPAIKAAIELWNAKTA